MTDFLSQPDAVFLNPWRDGGLQLLRRPEKTWQSMPKTRIAGVAASAEKETTAQLEKLIRTAERDRNFAEAICFASVPVLIDNASFVKSYVAVRDQLLLSGAVGTRLLNRYRWVHEEAGLDGNDRLDAYFATCREKNAAAEIPAISDLLETDIAFAVPCRNTFNYFHFLTESLCQLTLLDEINFEGDIIFHFPNPEDRQRPFAKAFVEALFPEYVGRVHFQRAPRHYDKVMTGYDMAGGLFQAPEADIAGIADLLPDSLKKKGGVTSVAARRPLSANIVNASLLALRERALKAIEGQDFSHLPKRFFVGRDDRRSRMRRMEGEDMLFEHLDLFGFDYVVFESLDPLEQIALMAGAEIMVSYHGAGFTNMLFANPDACVIELGNLQTAQQRWGDFWPLAHAAGCTYVTFFGDTKEEDPEELAQRDTGGLASVSISREATGQIMAFIVSFLGQYPTLKSAGTVEKLARTLLRVGAKEHAMAVLENHAELLAGHAELCLLKADCHKAMHETKSELVALDSAFKADPSRWQMLIRIIWCANSCERPQVIRWALSRLKADFPERHAAFISNHDWIRYVA
ncbi:glycosyltransferase 61 family protein [Marimonas sp. MJW-29]|uniref:Glycosyltransferase 61 family protein n=1 Tax=Sulfitobacter sediminis TaxID=3234186 RepID=A0ABV3RNJ2_9RHOB